MNGKRKRGPRCPAFLPAGERNNGNKTHHRRTVDFSCTYDFCKGKKEEHTTLLDDNSRRHMIKAITTKSV